MTFRQVILSINGLRERDLMWQHVARRITTIIASTNFGGGKIAAKMNKLWPIGGDGTTGGVSDRARETLQRFREMDALKIANETVHARRTKNTGKRRGKTGG